MNRQNSNTYNSIYVSLTRGKSDIRVYTDDIKTLQEQVKNAKVKNSTLDYPKGNTLVLQRNTVSLKPVVTIAKSFLRGKDHSKDIER